jgi:hypothetical protein
MQVRLTLGVTERLSGIDLKSTALLIGLVDEANRFPSTIDEDSNHDPYEYCPCIS